MKTRIFRSRVVPTLDGEIRAYVDELANWKTHMAQVERDRDADMSADKRHMPYPKPWASPIVEACVGEDGQPSYEIVDDGPAASSDLAFIAQVNAHIEGLRIFDALIEGVRRLIPLRSTPEPKREDCDSDATYQSALWTWRQAQLIQYLPTPPSASATIERAIKVHTAADGSSRTYSYSDDLHRSIFGDDNLRPA